MDLQFYPSSKSLGLKMAAKFTNKKVTRVLEPSAGRADLIESFCDEFHFSPSHLPVDCCEIDPDNVAILRSKKLRVVGLNFLQYSGRCSYSHIIMNPPFNRGVDHVLHAWDILVHGEVVAVINANSVRNATTKAQRKLAYLIEEFGSVEYLQETFLTEDTKRKTDVEVALIHLNKVDEFKVNYTEGLAKEDNTDRFDIDDIGSPSGELMLPKTAIQNTVLAFNAAVEAARDSAKSSVRSEYFANMLGASLREDKPTKSATLTESVAARLNEAYDDLKERAWSHILKSSDVTKRLSSNGQKKLLAGFEEIKTLEFTVANIYGFLDGVIAQQSDMQIEMMCDTFDEISKFHSQNRAFYQGWKSNDKHRVNAWRIMMTRFILPSKDRSGWSVSQLCWDDVRRFEDFDKVFAMLDGKSHETVYGLVKLFNGFTDPENPENSKESKYAELARGERLACDYFEVRYYPQAGTFHIFPTRKDLIDRLNRMVGRHRQWLPEEHEKPTKGFWKQFDQAEKINRKIKMDGIRDFDLHKANDQYKDQAHEMLLERHEQALAECKIDFDGLNKLEA